MVRRRACAVANPAEVLAARLTAPRFPSHNEPRVPVCDQKRMRRSVSRMLRGLFLIVVALVAAGPALAGEIDTCRDPGAEPVIRQAACESVIADDKISGKPKAVAFGVRGEALNKKHDY